MLVSIFVLINALCMRSIYAALAHNDVQYVTAAMLTRDFYQLFKLNPKDVDLTKLQTQYVKLALHFHESRNAVEDAALAREKTKLINDAYHTLVDQKLRDQYHDYLVSDDHFLGVTWADHIKDQGMTIKDDGAIQYHNPAYKYFKEQLDEQISKGNLTTGYKLLLQYASRSVVDFVLNPRQKVGLIRKNPGTFLKNLADFAYKTVYLVFLSVISLLSMILAFYNA